MPRRGASQSVGIDIDFNLFAHDFDIQEFPQICVHFGGHPDRCLLIEADIFNLTFKTGFDYCGMYDSIEHVPQPNRFIDYAARSLVPGGFLIVETGALYHGPSGHHLFDYFPLQEAPWVHRWSDFDDLLTAKNPHPWLMEQFNLLNKVTRPQIIEAITASGLEVTKEIRGAVWPPDRASTQALYDKFRHRLRPEFADDTELLFENWIAIVAQKPIQKAQHG